MQNNSFSVLFFIKKSKLLKNGEVPICMRIKVNNKRAEVQVKRSVEPDKWNHLKGCAVGKDGYHHGRLWSVRTPGSGKGPELCL